MKIEVAVVAPLDAFARYARQHMESLSCTHILTMDDVVGRHFERVTVLPGGDPELYEAARQRLQGMRSAR